VLILDTNVISEVLRPAPNDAVVTWFDSQPHHQLFTTAVTQAEILYGIRLLPKGSRRQKLLQVAQLIFEEDLENRVLPFNGDAASHYAEIGATRKSSGWPISQFDAMIAAIARLHGGKVVTRNVLDFDHCGIDLINPWDT
jgi:toxin FitB